MFLISRRMSYLSNASLQIFTLNKKSRRSQARALWPVWKLALQVGDDGNASRLWVVEKTMRIGEATVRFGGIAGVGTRREHRRKDTRAV